MQEISCHEYHYTGSGSNIDSRQLRNDDESSERNDCPGIAVKISQENSLS